MVGGGKFYNKLYNLNWRFRLSWDVVLIVSFAVLGGSVAWVFVHQVGSVFFYQSFTPEALMWACGHGFRHPLLSSPDMVAFLLQRTLATFDCSSIAANVPTGPPGIFFHMQLYLSWIAAGLWRLLGTSQLALVPLAAFLGGGYAAGNYMLARLFLPRWLAAGAAFTLALSPVAIGQIFSLRDFSKAPFLLWTIALLLLSGRKATPRRKLLTAALAGMVAGIGYGFRADVAIILPLGLGFLVLVPASLAARSGLISLFVGSFVLLASPLLLSGARSSSGFLVMQGATEPFRAFLALRPAPYGLGHAYSDELTFSSVAAEERSRHPDWDAHEAAPIYGMSQAITLSSANLVGWAPHFAADFMGQALKGAGWILGYPALVAVSRGNPDPGTPLRLDVPIVRWQEPFYAVFGQPWMPLLGLVGVLALLLRVAARNGREAFATAGLLFALLTYPAIQFSIRHIFYLEFIWVIGLLSIPCAVMEQHRLRPVLPRFAVSAALTVGLLTAVYAGLARLQQQWLTSDFTDLLALPRESVAVARNVQDDGAVLLRVPVPPVDRAILDGTPDSMTPRIAEIGIEYDVRASGERMLMTLGGSACPTGAARIRLLYDHRPDVWQPLDSTLTMRTGAIAVFPAFYRETQNFAGVLLPPSHASCETGLFSLPITHSLPFVLTAVLPEGWQSLPLRKGLGRFDVGPPS